MTENPEGAFNDTADWTWVLERPCPQCGYAAGEADSRQVSNELRGNTQQWLELLAGDPAELARRPRPDKWAPIEYAFHVRDVCEIYDQRLRLMLTEDGPRYPNWDQDATAVEKDYLSADPPTVASELTLWSSKLADLFDTVTGEQWNRTGYRSDGADFTVDTFARYFIHDPIHHLWDVRN